ncbi:MAG TPA: isoprenylcysteine carboxylmethyltransferase family protein [Ignavibacteria bacterium]|nr:isoprenylcysteine carboxylmethyltransferase family protein [Ignavibacteria bacterium]
MKYVLVLLQFTIIGIFIFLGNVLPNNTYSGILIIAGVTVGIFAMYEMNFKFSIFPDLPKDYKLVTTGIYSKIRHPMYLAVMLITLSFILNDFSILKMILWVFLLLILILKSQFEENHLSEKFKSYSVYKQHTKRIIPFLL